MQHVHTKGVPSDPDVVSTTYAVRALLQAADLDPEYAELARTAPSFVIEDLNYREVPDGAKIDYHMNHPDDSYTLNAAALGAGMFVDLYDRTGNEALRDRATKILDHVAANQTDVGGWPYRLPADASHLSMDSHHNGFIIESFQRYRDVVDEDRYSETLEDALEFYRTELFELDGAPNFDESNGYPATSTRARRACWCSPARATSNSPTESSGGCSRTCRSRRAILLPPVSPPHQASHADAVVSGWMAYALSEYLLARSESDRFPSV